MIETTPDWAEWRRAAVACLTDRPRDLPRAPSPPPLLPGRLVRHLRVGEVRWVLDGSVVLLAAGADIHAGDLDVVPALDEANLERLATVLDRLDAFPEPAPHWEHGLSLDEASRWRSRPAIETNLNHRFVTEFGILDIVPRLTGTYAELLEGAWTTQVEGQEIAAAELAPILDRLRRSKRRKDQQRWKAFAHVMEEPD